VLLGYQSGYSIANGSNNIFLGYQAGYNETGSNKLYIENSDSSTPLIYGEFDNKVVKLADHFTVDQSSGDRYLYLRNFTIQDDSVYDLKIKSGSNGRIRIGSPIGKIDFGTSVTTARMRFELNQSSSEFSSSYVNQLIGSHYVNHLQSYTVLSTESSDYGTNTTPKGHPIYIYAGQNTASGVWGNVILQSTPTSSAKGNVGIGLEAPDTKLHVAGDVKSDGRYIENLSPSDIDTQDGTLSASNINGGIVVHTSETSPGTLTTDTAVNIISTCNLSEANDTVKCYVVNDGDQLVDFAAGTDVTIIPSTATMPKLTGRTLIFQYNTSTTVTMYIV